MESRPKSYRQVPAVPALPNVPHSPSDAKIVPMSTAPLPLAGLMQRASKRPHSAAKDQGAGVHAVSKRRMLLPPGSSEDGSPPPASTHNASASKQNGPSSSNNKTIISGDVFATSSLFSKGPATTASNTTTTVISSTSIASSTSTGFLSYSSSSRAKFFSAPVIESAPPAAPVPQQPRALTYLAPTDPTPSDKKQQQQQQEQTERSPTPFTDVENDMDVVEQKITLLEEEDAYTQDPASSQKTDDGFQDDDDGNVGPPASQTSSYWDGPASQMSREMSASQASRVDDEGDEEDADLRLEPDEERHGSVGAHEVLDDVDEDDERGTGGGSRRSSRSFSRAVEDFASREGTQEPEHAPFSDEYQNEEVPDIPPSQPQRRSSVWITSLVGDGRTSRTRSDDNQPASSSSPRASSVAVVQQQQERRAPSPPAAPAPRALDALIRAAVERSGTKWSELEAKYEAENLEGDAFVKRGDELLVRVSNLLKKVHKHLADRVQVFLDVGKDVDAHKEELVKRAERLDEHRAVMLEYGKKPEL